MTNPEFTADPSPLASPPLDSAPPAIAAATPRDVESFLSDAPTLALVLAAMIGFVGAAFFSTLAASLLRAVADSPNSSSNEGEDPAPDRTEAYAASASVAAYIFRALAAGVAFLWFLRLLSSLADAGRADGLPAWMACGLALTATALVVGPLMHLVTQSIPVALAAAHGERLLAATLGPFTVIQPPLGAIVRVLNGARRIALRVAGTPDADTGTRRIVEGLRAMVEGADLGGDLHENTRELIANVIDFGAADAAEVMTPRTEIRAVDRDATLADAIEVFASSGFSRIPVYEETVDTIIGTLTALEAAKAVAEDRVERTSIIDVMRPPLLVPETQLVPELLSAFRAERQKMAIVVDEYGGTAGLVTLADVMAEILGHVQDEFEAEERPYVRLEADRVEADASEHVSEVNEELGVALPEEEDYETLAGFVLAEFGRFPTAGESFEQDGVTFTVSEASDRRVLRVVLHRPGGLSMQSEAKADERESRIVQPPREGGGTTIALRPGHGRSVLDHAAVRNGDERRRA